MAGRARACEALGDEEVFPACRRIFSPILLRTGVFEFATLWFVRTRRRIVTLLAIVGLFAFTRIPAEAHSGATAGASRP